METIYHDFLDTVPFCNFRHLLEEKVCSFDPKIGGDCVYHAKELVERLLANGHKAGFIKPERYRHLAVIGEGNTLMDSSLLHKDPILLDPISKRGTPETFSAFPMIDNEKGAIKVVPLGDDRFEIFLERGAQSVSRGIYNLSLIKYETGDFLNSKLSRWLARYSHALTLPDSREGVVRQLFRDLESGELSASVIKEQKSERCFFSLSRQREAADRIAAEITEKIGMKVRDLLDVFDQANKFVVRIFSW